MGDRCYMRLNIARKDLPVFEDIGFMDAEGCNSGASITVEDPEANYAHYTELENLAMNGVVFEGYHGQGGEYEAAVVASDGAEYAEANTIDSKHPAVSIGPDGNVMNEQLNIATNYWRVYARAREKLDLLDMEHQTSPA